VKKPAKSMKNIPVRKQKNPDLTEDGIILLINILN